MTRQVTISAAYGRLPGKKVYNAEIRVSSAPAGEVLKQSVDAAMEMRQIISEIHRFLQEYPKADVVMERGAVGPSYFGQKTLRRFLLDNEMRDLIRDDLEEAQRAFAPIERTVRMRS